MDDVILDIYTTFDGEYILTGITDSNDGDVYGNHSDTSFLTLDIWILRLGTTSAISEMIRNQGQGLYPNPAKKYIYVPSHFLNYPNISLNLFNVSGSLICKKSVSGEDDAKIDISNLDEGLYLYTLSTSDGLIQNGKLVIIP